MKIALCISGLPRCYNYHHSTILNMFHPFKPDVFMYLWDDNISDQIKDDIIQCWNPTYIKFEKTKTELFSEWTIKTNHIRTNGRSHANAFPMWYGIYQVNCMKKEYELKNKFTYDAVCRTRSDIWVKNPWEGALENVESNSVIMSPKNRFDGGYNDTIVLGDSASIDKYCDLWNWFPTALEKSQIIGYEIMLKNYIDNWTDLKSKFVNLDYKVIRPDEKNLSYEQVSGGPSLPPPNNLLTID